MSSLGFVLVAAGSSQRFRAHPGSHQHSKLLIEWAGKPLFIHTLEALLQFDCKKISVACRRDRKS